MKAIRSLATIVVAFVALSAVSVKGQTNQESVIPPGLPDTLPIGSREKVLDWVVTNRVCAVNFKIMYTNMVGSWVGALVASNKRFDSYRSYQQTVTDYGMYMYNKYRTNMDPISVLQSRNSVSYADVINEEVRILDAMNIITNIGLVSSITSNSFAGLVPTNNWVMAIVPLPGLERFSVEVDSDPPYSYAWQTLQPHSFINSVVSRTREMTTNDLLYLNDWYSKGDYRARLEVTANGETRTYTQHGDWLRPPSANMVGSRRLRVSTPKGSDLTVESTTDFVNWQTVTNLLWSVTATNDSLDLVIDPCLPKRFFRAMVR